MEEGEEQDQDQDQDEEVTTEEIFDLIGNIDDIYNQLKDFETLKYKLKYTRKAKEFAEKKRDEYQDLLRQSESANYDLKKSNVTLEQHNSLQKEHNDLKQEYHDLVNRSEIRYQTVNQELITLKNECKDNFKIPSSQAQVLQSTKRPRGRPKKQKDVIVRQPHEDELEIFQPLVDLEKPKNVELNKLDELTTKNNVLREQNNKITKLYERLQKEMEENTSKYQKTIHSLKDQARNKEAETGKLLEKLNTLNLQNNLLREGSATKNGGTVGAEICIADMPTIFNDCKEKSGKIQGQLQPKNELKESEKLAELERIASTNHNRIKELTDKLTSSKTLHQNEIKALKDDMQKEIRENSIKNQKTIDSLNECLRDKDAKIETLVEEINALHLQINLSQEDSNGAKNCTDVGLPAFNEVADNNKICVPHLEQQHRSGDESDPPTDEIHAILRATKYSIEIIPPLICKSDVEVTKDMDVHDPELIAESTPENLGIIVNRTHRKLNKKQKNLKDCSKNLRRIRWRQPKSYYLQNNDLKATLKELRLVKYENHLLKKQIRLTKCYANLKMINQDCNDKATQCTEISSKPEEAVLPNISPLPQLTIAQKKIFTQHLKIRKKQKQQFLDDIPKWNTDSYFSYPSAESDIESQQLHPTIRRKKFTKQKYKQKGAVGSSDEDDVTADKDIQKKQATTLNDKSTTIALNDAEAVCSSSETIYAKAQGSVDSGYVKSDSGEESDIGNGKRKPTQSLNETCKKQKCAVSKISIPKKDEPENPPEVERCTKAMAILFGSDSESHSSGLDSKAVVTQPLRKPTTNYLQRVDAEKHVNSSDSDLLRGFVNNCYSSVSKSDVLASAGLHAVATAATKIDTPGIAQKQTKVPTPCKEQNINLVSNDLLISDDYSTTCTETEEKTRSVLLDDGTQSLSCKVISAKTLSNQTKRKGPKKVKHSVPVPIKMTLRSANRKTDEESAKSSSDCRTSHSERPSTRKQSDTRVLQKINAKKVAQTRCIRTDCLKSPSNSLSNSRQNSESDEVKRSFKNYCEEVNTRDKCVTNSRVGRIARSGTDEEKSIVSGKAVGNKNSTNIRNFEDRDKSGTDNININNFQNKDSSDKLKTNQKSIPSSEDSEINDKLLSTKRSEAFEEKSSNKNHSEHEDKALPISARKTETTVQNLVSNSTEIRRSHRISARKSRAEAKSTTDTEKSISNSENRGSASKITARICVTDDDSIINSNQYKNLIEIKAGTENKSRTDDDSVNTGNYSEIKRSLRVAAKTSITDDEKSVTNRKTSQKKSSVWKISTGTDEETNVNNNSFQNSSIGTRISGTKDKSGTDGEKSVTNRKSCEVKGKVHKIATGASATDEEPNTNRNSFENKDSFRRIRTRSSTSKSGTDTEKSVINRKNSENNGSVTKITTGAFTTDEETNTNSNWNKNEGTIVGFGTRSSGTTTKSESDEKTNTNTIGTSSTTKKSVINRKNSKNNGSVTKITTVASTTDEETNANSNWNKNEGTVVGFGTRLSGITTKSESDEKTITNTIGTSSTTKKSVINRKNSENNGSVPKITIGVSTTDEETNTNSNWNKNEGTVVGFATRSSRTTTKSESDEKSNTNTIGTSSTTKKSVINRKNSENNGSVPKITIGVSTTDEETNTNSNWNKNEGTAVGFGTRSSGTTTKSESDEKTNTNTIGTSSTTKKSVTNRKNSENNGSVTKITTGASTTDEETNTNSNWNKNEGTVVGFGTRSSVTTTKSESDEKTITNTIGTSSTTKKSVINRKNSENNGSVPKITIGVSTTDEETNANSNWNKNEGTVVGFATRSSRTTTKSESDEKSNTNRIGTRSSGIKDNSGTNGMKSIINRKNCGTSSNVCKISTKASGTDEEASTNTNSNYSENKDRFHRIHTRLSTSKSGTDDDKSVINRKNYGGTSKTSTKTSGTDEETNSNSNCNENNGRCVRIGTRSSTRKSGTDDDKSVINRKSYEDTSKTVTKTSGTDEKTNANSNCNENNGSFIRNGTRSSTSKSGTDDDKPVINKKNCGSTSSLCKINTKTSGTDHEKSVINRKNCGTSSTRTDEESNTHSNCSESNGRSLTIGTSSSTTTTPSGTDDEKSNTHSRHSQYKNSAYKISPKKSETNEKSIANAVCSANINRLVISARKSGIDDHSSVHSESSKNNGSSCKIVATTSEPEGKSGTDSELALHSKIVARAVRVSPRKSVPNRKYCSKDEAGIAISRLKDASGTDEENCITNGKNFENKARTKDDSITDEEKPIPNNYSSKNNGNSQITIREAHITTDPEMKSRFNLRSKTRGEQSGSSGDEPSTNCKKFTSGSKSCEEGKPSNPAKQLGAKRKYLTKPVSSEKNPCNYKNCEPSNKIPKLKSNHPASEGLTNEQLLTRKRVAEMLKHTTGTNNCEKVSFKRPNTRRRIIESVALPSSDQKLARLEPRVKLSILPSLDHKAAAITQNVNSNLITYNQSMEASPNIKASGSNVLPSLDEKNPTSKLPHLATLEVSVFPSLDSEAFESPTSPILASDNQQLLDIWPKSIPLETQNGREYDVGPNAIPVELDDGARRAKSLIYQLLQYCKSADMAQEVTNALLCEHPHFIAKLILEVTFQNIHDKVELFNYRRAPLLTIIQRLMLGLLLNLEEKGLRGVINHFLVLSEKLLVTLKEPSHISPPARLHAAICKLQFDYARMRLMLCKAVFFMGDAAIPYLYIVLCSWLELIPCNSDNLSGQDALETRTLVQVIRLKRCTQPEYNQYNLQKLLNQYHGYPFEHEDSEKLLEDLFRCYVGQKRTVLVDVTAESVIYLTAALCESIDKNIVFKQLDRLKIRVVVATSDNEICGIVYLVGIISSQYREDDKASANVGANKEWLQQFCSDAYPASISSAAKDVLRKF